MRRFRLLPALLASSLLVLPGCDDDRWFFVDYPYVISSALTTTMGEPFPNETRLHTAARDDDPAMVRKLVKQGWDPNSRGKGRQKQGATPLHVAASLGNLRAARALLEVGADPNLGAARQPGKGIEDDLAPLFLATCAGHVDVLKLLLEAGAQPPKKLANLHLALQGAAWDGNREMIRFWWRRVLEQGGTGKKVDLTRSLLQARRSSRSSNPDRPGDGTSIDQVHLFLDFASATGDVELVEAILAHLKEKKLSVDGSGVPAIEFAAAFGQPEIVRRLLDAGADGWDRDKIGHTVLHRVFQLLAKYKPTMDMELRGKGKGKIRVRFPMVARLRRIRDEGGHAAVVKLLIADGVDVGAKARKKTALDLAREAGDEASVKQLEAALKTP